MLLMCRLHIPSRAHVPGLCAKFSIRHFPLDPLRREHILPTHQPHRIARAIARAREEGHTMRPITARPDSFRLSLYRTLALPPPSKGAKQRAHARRVWPPWSALAPPPRAQTRYFQGFPQEARASQVLKQRERAAPK